MPMQLYVVRAPTRLSNGERQNGHWRGFSWTEGFAGPFSERRADQVLGQVGGTKHGFGSVPEKAVMRELQRIEDTFEGETLFEEEKSLPDLLQEEEPEEENSQDEQDSQDEGESQDEPEGETEGFEAVEETAEDLSEESQNEVNVFPEEAGYHEMLRYMGAEDFDWQEYAEGRSGDEVTRVYKEEFLPTRNL